MRPDNYIDKLPIKKTSKYKNEKIIIDGIIFDSKKEAKRYTELKLLEKANEISDLELQVCYELIPEQREPETISPRGKIKKGKLLERKCEYRADFVYKDKAGKTIVEDTKGFRTKEYKIKKKLMLFVYGIKIVEI